MYVRRKVAIRSFIEAGLSTYGRADSVAKEPGRIRRLVFANGLRFNCKNLTSKCTSLRFTCNRHWERSMPARRAPSFRGEPPRLAILSYRLLAVSNRPAGTLRQPPSIAGR
jgi:hypothetical protein